MNHETSNVIEGLDRREMSHSDMEAAPTPRLIIGDEESALHQLEIHHQHKHHDHAHVDLMKEEYVPEEVAAMLGTSVEVVMHAIWHGELHAKKIGHHIVSVPRTALLDWYKVRG